METMEEGRWVIVWVDPYGDRCTTVHDTAADAAARWTELVTYLAYEGDEDVEIVHDDTDRRYVVIGNAESVEALLESARR